MSDTDYYVVCSFSLNREDKIMRDGLSIHIEKIFLDKEQALKYAKETLIEVIREYFDECGCDCTDEDCTCDVESKCVEFSRDKESYSSAAHLVIPQCITHQAYIGGMYYEYSDTYMTVYYVVEK